MPKDSLKSISESIKELRDTEPTIKQKLAFQKVVKGSSLTKAMKDVGYSESTSKRTNKLTNTKGWQKLLDKHISDAKLTKVLEEGLEAGKKIFKNEEEIGYDIDYAVRHKYLETGLKLKNKFPSEKMDLTSGGEPIKPTQIFIPKSYESNE